MTELHSLSAIDLLAQFRSRALSPVEVTAAVLARIAQYDHVLNATYALDPAGARAAAKASEARWRSGQPCGTLDGVPVMIKENIATKGTPSPIGTAASLLEPARADAPPAARLREAGAVLLGKTTMPDFGMLSSGTSSLHALSRNPFALSKGPGGSSGGAAAAVAAGFAPLHVGTDIGGSVRLPAGWCGIFGLKPSHGRIPIDPAYVGRVAGPMTRTVADAALMMEVLSRPDRRDATSLPGQTLPWQNLQRDIRGLRVGLWLAAGVGLPVEPEIAAAVQAAARLYAAAGAIVEPVAPFLTRRMLDGLDQFWRQRALSETATLPPDRYGRILPYIRAWMEGGRGASGAQVFDGFSQIAAMRHAAHASMAEFDYMLAPTAPIPAFDAEWPSPTNDPARPFEHIAFTVAFNMSGQPAASINCGSTSQGLPIGLQIIGQRFDDVGVLQMAKAFEDMRGPQQPWPTLVARAKI